jgi:superfamily II DNA or RNA helicase
MSGFFSRERLINGPWQAFERAIARLLIVQGWDVVELVGGSGDKGADVIASSANREVVYQAKYKSDNSDLSVPIVDDVKRAMEFYKIKEGVCCSNRNLGLTQKRRLKELTSGVQGYSIISFTGASILRSFEKLPEWFDDGKSVRKHQEKAIEELKRTFLNDTGRGLISLATGLGKTFVAGSFINWLYNEVGFHLNILILADKRSLIEQFDRAIWTSLPKSVSTHLLHQSEKPGYDSGVTIATFQSFAKYKEENPELQYDIVIVDEAHHSMAPTYKDVIMSLNARYLLGLTATPFRRDNQRIEELFGSPLVKIGVEEAIKNHLLCKVNYILHTDNIDEDWITLNSNQGYTIKQLNKKVFLPERDDAIAEIIINYWNKKGAKKGIIFCNSNEHCERVESIMRSQRIPTQALTMRAGNNREQARRLRAFRQGQLNFITCFDMLNEGIDVPDVDMIVFLRVTHSPTYFLQQLGRGLRKPKDNPEKELLVLDFVADLRRIGRVQALNDGYNSSNIIEDIELPENFNLEITNKYTKNFIDLVENDEGVIDELDETRMVYLKKGDN